MRVCYQILVHTWHFYSILFSQQVGAEVKWKSN